MLALTSHTTHSTPQALHLEDDSTHSRDYRDQDLLAAIESDSTTFKMADGTSIPVSWKFRETYTNEYTAEQPPNPQIQEAVIDEMRYFNDVVWEGVPLAQAHADAQGKVLNGRWVFCNKGDLAEPDCRVRYVACELNLQDDLSYFAATPPLEAKRLLLSQWASQRQRDGKRLQLHVADAKRLTLTVVRQEACIYDSQKNLAWAATSWVNSCGVAMERETLLAYGRLSLPTRSLAWALFREKRAPAASFTRNGASLWLSTGTTSLHRVRQICWTNMRLRFKRISM